MGRSLGSEFAQNRIRSSFPSGGARVLHYISNPRPSSSESGLFEVTSPNGDMSVTYRPFLPSSFMTELIQPCRHALARLPRKLLNAKLCWRHQPPDRALIFQSRDLPLGMGRQRKNENADSYAIFLWRSTPWPKSMGVTRFSADVNGSKNRKYWGIPAGFQILLTRRDSNLTISYLKCER
jgi:hypothetical protein